MTKRNGLNSWDHETDSECTADCHTGQEEDNGHFFMLPSRNMSDVRPKTNVYSRVDAKKPPTLASGFRVRAFSANRRFVSSSIKKQAKSFHAPENERVIPVKSRSRSLDLGTTKQERSAYNEDLQSDADINQAKTESKSDDTRHELCDSIRFGRSGSWSIDIIPAVKRIPVLESSKKPFGKLTRRSSVGVANRAKLGKTYQTKITKRFKDWDIRPSYVFSYCLFAHISYNKQKA